MKQQAMSREERLTEKTIKIIKAGGRILLRKGRGRTGDSYWYMDSWTNIAAGPDHAVWTKNKGQALEMFNLLWAHTIAPLYGSVVVIVYPKKKTIECKSPKDDGIPLGGYTCSCQALK